MSYSSGRRGSGRRLPPCFWGTRRSLTASSTFWPDVLASYLTGRGVGPDSRVGLALEPSKEMVVGILGILKAGGAYVPLDPGYPAERLAFMVRDTSLTLLLTQADLSQAHAPAEGAEPDWALPEAGAPVVCLDSQWEQIEQHATAGV